MIKFSDNTIGALEFSVTWEKDGATHEEWFLGRKFNPVNDIFPQGMREGLEGKQAGDSVSFTYEPRMCIPRYKEKLVLTVGTDRLRKKTVFGKDIIPTTGRFYPQGHINRLRDIYPDTLTPFRFFWLDDETFIADCNHPLAKIPVTIDVKIQYVEERRRGTYGSLTHWREATCDWGPGMQAMHEGKPTVFSLPNFFDRLNDNGTPFSPPLTDDKAMKNFENLYARFITPDMRILDLSHDSTSAPTGEYDAITCTQSIEYLADPINTLKTIRHHLKPGGVILIGFTNHFDMSRVIQGWIDLHEFERMGLVLDYLRQADLDTRSGTISIRNDWRLKDDPKFLETRGVSDPVYVVYGHKA